MLGLLLVGGAVLYFLSARTPAPVSEVIDVSARARAMNVDANVADVYFRTPKLSVHQHFMGRRQLCPLHIHPHGLELTLIVDGKASVRHGTKTARGAATLQEGEALSMPAGCAHEWTNADREQPLANLVFSSPAFEHNTYIPSFDDDRIGADAATFWSAKEEIAAFKEGAARDVPLELFNGAMHLLLVRSDATIDAGPTTAAYVLAGRGTIAGLAVKAKHLAILRETKPLRVHADEQLALLYLRAE